MKHLTALFVKFVMVAIILELVLSILSSLSFTQILYISVAVTLVAYFIGDLLILSISNNIVATIADAGLIFLTIYTFNYARTYRTISFSDALIAAVITCAGEWVFHKYVARRVFPDREEI